MILLVGFIGIIINVWAWNINSQLIQIKYELKKINVYNEAEVRFKK